MTYKIWSLLGWVACGMFTLLGNEVSKAEYSLVWIMLIAYLLRDIYREICEGDDEK